MYLDQYNTFTNVETNTMRVLMQYDNKNNN